MRKEELKASLMKDAKRYNIESGPEMVQWFHDAYCDGFKYKELAYRSDLYTPIDEMYDVNRKVEWLVENRIDYLDECFND